MRILLLVSIVLAMGTGCSAIRATSAQTQVPLADYATCLPRDQLSRDLGGVDDRIDIPGGGQIEVYDVRLRPENLSPGRTWVTSVASLGIMDLAAGIVDSAQGCTEDLLQSGGYSQCDYKVLRYFVHYSSEASDQPACVEMREDWAGAGYEPWGDSSTCPAGYRAALAEVIDTSEFPPPTTSNIIDVWNEGLDVQGHLQFLDGPFGRGACSQF